MAKIAANGETAVPYRGIRIQVGRDVRGALAAPRQIRQGVLKGLSEIGFGVEGVNGGIELAKLVFALAETGRCRPQVPSRPGRQQLPADGYRRTYSPGEDEGNQGHIGFRGE